MTNNLLAGGIQSTNKVNNPLFKGGIIEYLTFAASPREVLQTLIPPFIGILFVAGVIIFMFMLLWGAVQWIISGGEKAGIEGAKGRITSAIVGLVLLLSTFAVIKLIETFFGINILSIDIAGLSIQ